MNFAVEGKNRDPGKVALEATLGRVHEMSLSGSNSTPHWNAGALPYIVHITSMLTSADQ